MAKNLLSARWERAQVLLTGIVVGVVVVGVLYWAQMVLIPVALAIFFTFLLSPVVIGLQRCHLGRIPAVILTTALALGIVLAVAALTISQATRLVEELPSYSDIIEKKVHWVRDKTSSQTWTRFEGMVRHLNLTGSPAPSPPPEEKPEGRTPSERIIRTPIIVGETDPLWVRLLPSLFRPTLESLGQFGLMAVLVVFMLLNREDLRNRFIRLVGHGRMTLTTKAVDDASQRISRFLLMQLVVNACYGLIFGLGLMLIGLRFALFWGLLIGVLRYIPYIGAPATSLFPIILSLAQFESWWPAVLVIALVLILELVAANLVEPRLYGQSIGVSEVALLIAAAFWAFLWGPVGLILSCPLTVCLVVLGKYVPQLEFLAVLLGDQPVLAEDITYYQRLSAKDQDEASQMVRAALEQRPVDEVYDALLLPALSYALRDRQRNLLDEDDEQFIQQATKEIFEEVVEQQEKQAEATGAEMKQIAAEQAANGPATSRKVRILGVPARDGADTLALEMLRQLLDPAKWELQIASVDQLTAELVERVEEKQPALICIASLAPGGLAHTRYLCKRLRGHFPKLQILVGRWSFRSDGPESLEPIRNAGATHVETTLLGTRNHLNGWLPALLARAPGSPTQPRHDDCTKDDLHEYAQPAGSAQRRQPNPVGLKAL